MKQQCVLLSSGNSCPLEDCNQFVVLATAVEKHTRQILQLSQAFKTKKMPRKKQNRWVDGTTIARFRQHYHVTQLEMGLLLGVHVITVSRWENGKMGIRPQIQKMVFDLSKKSEEEVRCELDAKIIEYLAK